MARYTVSRKMPGMGFTVLDSSEAAAFSAKHHAGLQQERWDLADLQGRLLATLTLERMHTNPTYTITTAGEQPFVLSRDSAFAPTWQLVIPTGNLYVGGDTGSYDWKMVDEAGGIHATGHRLLASAHQKYLVEVEGDPSLALCVTLAIESERMHGRESAFGPIGWLMS